MVEPRGDGQVADVQIIRHLDEVTGALDALSDVLDHEEDLSLVLQRVCQQAIRAIPGADIASVTLLRDDRPRTAAMTDDHALDVDIAQYQTGEGPCLESAKTGQVCRVAVAEVRQRWPQFAEATDGMGVRSYLSAPLFIDNEYHGSLNLYGMQSDGYRELDAALLELYTTAVEAALRTASRYVQARKNADQLRMALNSRATIDQAKGIIMGAHGVPADQAFAMLVEQSQRDNIKLRSVAEQLIERVVQPED
jgi:transcriptional regulator with GAF, ATPase, and Fis domain